VNDLKDKSDRDVLIMLYQQNKTIIKTNSDHEQRLRVLEKSTFKIIGALSLITIGIQFIAKIYF